MSPGRALSSAASAGENLAAPGLFRVRLRDARPGARGYFSSVVVKATLEEEDTAVDLPMPVRHGLI